MPRQQAPPTREQLARRISALEEHLQDLARGQRRLDDELANLSGLVAAGSGETAAPPPSRRSPPSRWKSLLRRLLRSTVGLARRVWQASDAPPEPPLSIEVDPRPARRLPSLGVVFERPATDDPLIKALDRQSESPAEVISWNPPSYTVESAGGERREGIATTLSELRQATTADYLLTANEALGSLPATTLELARFTCAAEDLAFLEIPVAGSAPLFLARRQLWHPAASLGTPAVEPSPRSAPAVGKTLGGDLGGRPDAGVREPGGDPGIPAGYRIVPGPRVRPLVHRLRPLTGLDPGAARGAAEGSQPAVLILLTSPLAGGWERLIADLLRHLGARFRFLVASLRSSDALQRRRLRQLERLNGALYPLADFLPPEIAPSALGVLARRHRIAAVLHLGGEMPAAAARELRGLSPPPPVVEPPSEGGMTLCGLPLPAPAGDRQGLRRALGVGERATLVTMASDLLVSARPEDFVALAHRFRGDDRFVFLLAGEGPLAGTVDDLERYLAPTHFRYRPALPAADLLAATDVACTTSEDQPLPYYPLAALAAGLPVVAADGGGLGALLATAGTGVPAGDLAAFEQAIRGLADAEQRRRLGERGRRVAERFRLEETMERYRTLLEDVVG